jgi:hypothetical protein
MKHQPRVRGASYVLGQFVLLLVITSCKTVSSTPTVDSPIAPQSPIGAGDLEPGRMLTALESLAVAQKRAQEWNPNAQWTAIMPTTVVASNFGFPLGAEGWFFKFDLPDSPVEYFIHVNDGVMSGASEAQPLIEPPYSLLPLKSEQLIVDSKEVLITFLESETGKEYLNNHPHPEWDYRLVHLEGTEHPVWSLFDAANDIAISLINIDAVSGKIVSDPFQ